jgi:hypothetical protein
MELHGGTRSENNMKFEYSSIQELIKSIEQTSDCKVVDCWQENKNYVLVIRNIHDKGIKLRVSML